MSRSLSCRLLSTLLQLYNCNNCSCLLCLSWESLGKSCVVQCTIYLRPKLTHYTAPIKAWQMWCRIEVQLSEMPAEETTLHHDAADKGDPGSFDNSDGQTKMLRELEWSVFEDDEGAIREVRSKGKIVCNTNLEPGMLLRICVAENGAPLYMRTQCLQVFEIRTIRT